jgi:hypothetical protein
MATTRGPAWKSGGWSARQYSGSAAVAGHGLVFVPMGFDAAQLLAIRPDGKDDVAASHVAWRFGKGTEQAVDSLVSDLIFMVNDGGIVAALEAKSGEMVWRGDRGHVRRRPSSRAVVSCLQRGW